MIVTQTYHTHLTTRTEFGSPNAMDHVGEPVAVLQPWTNITDM